MENYNKVKKASFIGIVLNLFLLLIKLLVGFISNSQAMIADGLNSAGDIFASLMSYIATKISSKPNDKDHPYGHGKAEYIFSQIIGISMILVAFSMIRQSIYTVINKQEYEFSIFLVLVAIITLIVKFSLYIYTKNLYKTNKSIILKSNMEDHKNDLFLTTATLIGITSGIYGMYFIDGVIGAMISLWIMYVGFNIFKDSYKILMDTGLDKEVIEDILNISNLPEEIIHVDSIATKPIGQKYIIMLKISMDGNMTIFSSHKITGIIKDKIKNKYDFVYDVIIHVNPH